MIDSLLQMKFRYWLVTIVLATLAWGVLVTLPRSASQATDNPTINDPASVGVAFANITLTPADRDLTIQGWWMPAAQPRAGLVFIHGMGSNRDSEFIQSLKFYSAVIEQGVSVVAIDLRNHGNSDSDERGIGWGVTEQADALAAIVWLKQTQPNLPLFAMGTSMGGATVIYAAASAPPIQGLILMDPLLNTQDTFKNGGWVATGLPAVLFAPSAWAATSLYGLPEGARQASAVAAGLKLPILLIQDPQDPVTRLSYAQELAQANGNVSLWIAPSAEPHARELAWKGRWGSHAAAFALFPEQTIAKILEFMGLE